MNYHILSTCAFLCFGGINCQGADNTKPPLDTEISFTIGAAFHPRSDVNGHHVQYEESFQVALIRPRPVTDRRHNDFLNLIGGVLGYRLMTDFTKRTNETDELFLGPLFRVYENGNHNLRLGLGANILTVRSTHDEVYSSETALGTWASLDYRYRWNICDDEVPFLGVSLGISASNIGVGGSRIAIGGLHAEGVFSWNF